MHKKSLINSLPYLFFILGSLAALNFSYTQLSELFGRLVLLTNRIESEKNDFQFNCRDEECHRCVVGTEQNPDAILFTGGSSFRYGVNMDELSKAFTRPLINCIKNDTRIDAYTAFFSHINIRTSEQIVLHGYNSWAINSPGPWVGKNYILRQFFNIPKEESDKDTKLDLRNNKRHDGKVTRIYKAYSTYLSIFHARLSAELPNHWRILLSAKFLAYNRNDMAYWPLTKEEHKHKKYQLMQKWIYKSPWVKSFIIGMGKVQPKQEITARHGAFITAVSPRKHIILFPAPELIEIFPSDIKNVIKTSKDILLDYINEQSIITHVEIDYKGCGITADDFWIDSVKIYDPAHPNSLAQTKITNCVTDALASRINQIPKT